MRSYFLTGALLWSAMAVAKPEMLYRFVMWRDDDTGSSFMSQVQRVGSAVIKNKCHYHLRFCGQAVEIENSKKICASQVQASGETNVVETHGQTQRLKFEIPGVIEDEPDKAYRVELNFSTRRGMMANMSKIEAIEKTSATETQLVDFGKKAAFFELSADCTIALKKEGLVH